ncbi:hypothetical protein HNR46_003663 [Haloferula luteola]|uniref:Uncharacterized protein n=1 Tax=Haloferula luteola TaxID=595692 RepID=A0A840V8M4_9BACT|nr:hypothetical protein [Haloferula luteola]MBB5353406.1 hypothetical protein [Haloferula luteola]
MIDKATIGILGSPIPSEIFRNPEKIFNSHPLLYDGQVVDIPRLNKDLPGSKKKILIGPGYAIAIYCSRLDGEWKVSKIEVNFPKLIYGHNGCVLSGAQFARALSILFELLVALWGDRRLASRLIPGIDPEGLAFWDKLELPMHLPDSVGVQFLEFYNASHPCSYKTLPVRDESITFGGHRSGVQIAVYRKRRQMREKYKAGHVDTGEEVLRLEVRLRKRHLEEAFQQLDSPTVKFSMESGREGEGRGLVSFTLDDVRRVHRSKMLQFRGMSQVSRSQNKPDQFGVYIAEAYHRFGSGDESVSAWIALFADLDRPVEGFAVANEKGKKSASRRMCRITRACYERLGSLRNRDLGALFCEEAYQYQPGVHVPKKEMVREHQIAGFDILPEIGDVYAPGWEGENEMYYLYPWLNADGNSAFYLPHGDRVAKQLGPRVASTSEAALGD